jgi:hypothetical protein
MFAAASCRSTSGLDAVFPHYSLQIRARGEDQPHGRRETSDFAQDEPFRNAAHCRIKAGPVPIVNKYT